MIAHFDHSIGEGDAWGKFTDRVARAFAQAVKMRATAQEALKVIDQEIAAANLARDFPRVVELDHTRDLLRHRARLVDKRLRLLIKILEKANRASGSWPQAMSAFNGGASTGL